MCACVGARICASESEQLFQRKIVCCAAGQAGHLLGWYGNTVSFETL